MASVMPGWMDPDQTSYLSGLFQQIVEDCKGELPLFDEFISKSLKLQSQLVSTVAVFGSFLDTAQKIADVSGNTKGSSTDIGICLERIVSKHRVMEVHMKTLTSTLSACLTLPVEIKMDSWRKKVEQLDREHAKQFKKMRAVVKKRREAVGKMKKKVKKRTIDPGLADQLERTEGDLESATEIFVEKEKAAVRDIQGVERTMFATFAAGWKQVIAEEFAMLNQVEKLGEMMEKIDQENLFPCNLLERSEYGFSPDMDKSSSEYTPSSSPYASKLRSESRKSRNSCDASYSSRHSSVDSHIDDKTSTLSSWNDTLVFGKSCPREERYSLSIYHQEHQNLWLSHQDRTQDIIKDSVCSPLSFPSEETGDLYKPSLPARGLVPEPHYSVPQNNTRVKIAGEEESKTQTRDDGLVTQVRKEVDHSGSESCSSGYSSNGLQQVVGQ